VVRSTTQIPTNASYTCTTITGATGYLWTLPAGWTAQAPAVLLSGTNYRTTSNSISVVPAGTGTVAVNLCVKAQGATTGSSATSVGCDSNTSANFTVNYITVNYSSALIYDVYSISGSCVTTVKQWRVNKTIYTPTSGNTSFGNITIGSAGGINNYVNVTGTNGSPVTQVCANIGTIATPVWVCATTFGSFTQRQANPALNAPKEEIKSVMIAPNPNSGNFNIKLASNDEMATATLFDFLGNKIQTYLLQKGDNAIQKENLKKGTYFVLLAVDGKEESRQIIIK
jgi:hypothetical protein